MENLQPPKPIQITSGEGAENRKAWQRWRESFETYLIASGADGKPEKVKKAILLFAIGEEGRRIRKTMTGIVDEVGDTETSCATLLDKFDAHFVEKTNVTFERHIFKGVKQNSRKFNEFITELREQAAKCNFGDKTDENIIDQVIFGLDSNKLRRKLFDVSGTCTLDNVVDTCRKWELLQEQLNIMQNRGATTSRTDSGETAHTDAVTRGRSRGRVRGRGSHRGSSVGRGRPTYSRSGDDTSQARTEHAQGQTQGQGRGQPSNKPRCYRCNTLHPKGQCLAWGKRCAKCNAMGHFAVCCASKKVFNVETQELNDVSGQPHETDDYLFQNMYD